MSNESLFSVCNSAALVGWAFILLTPLRFDWPRRVAMSIALVIACLYSALIGVYFMQAKGGFNSLAAVAQLFENRGLLLAGWVHYLAFDLLVGSWERKEARRINLAHWLLAPCLVLTFLFGPIGWLLFMGLRFFRIRTATGRPS